MRAFVVSYLEVVPRGKEVALMPPDDVTKFDPLALRRVAAQQRVNTALDQLERAQIFVNSARQQLSSVCGLSSEFDRLGRLRERIRATSYALQKTARRRKSQLVLDHDPRDEKFGSEE